MTDEQIVMILAMILYSQLCTSEEYSELSACIDKAEEMLKLVRDRRS